MNNRNRIHNGQGPSIAAVANSVVTRSRSASSSQSSATASSTSGSSSSGSSSSSSSSGSGSDSSSSDTEASRASSRASRTSRSSKKKAELAISSNSSNKSKVPLKQNHVPHSSSSVNKKPHANIFENGNGTTSHKSRMSGSVTNNKSLIASKVIAQRNFNKKKPYPASSESDSGSAVGSTQSQILKLGSKPKAIKKVIPVIPGRKNVVKSGSLTNGSLSRKVPTVNSSIHQKKLMKSIFSPDNSNDESDLDKTPKSSTSIKKNISHATSTTSPEGQKKNARDMKNFVKSLSPNSPTRSLSKALSSSSLTGSTSTSSCSSSGSSNESDKTEPKDSQRLKNKKVPLSSSIKPSTTKKRPVTRRHQRNTKSKTIPTTTAFNQSALQQSQQAQASAWDSDFSDEPKSLVRVPAKSNQKSRMKAIDEDEEVLERERKCPFPACDSQGHLSGLYPTHFMLPTCPRYHGFSIEDCKENAQKREKRENERKKYYLPHQPHHKKPTKLSQEAKNWLSDLKELKSQTIDGKPQNQWSTSEYDLSLWNDALALSAGRIEQEQSEAIGYRSVSVGKFEMSCWCASPYPEPLCHSRRLFICEFCLKPVQSGTVMRRHCAKCVWRHPPGDEIYRKERLSVWEVDGKHQKTYCQNLCLLAKCFLDHKTLYLDVDPFLFYVMTLADSQGCHLVGYFSKEKNSFLNYNVSCILTLPPYQRQGFGRLLIDFSYLLTRVEQKVGSPEKPLSDLGLISYRSYWKDAVLRRLCACATREMSVKDLSIELGVTSADLVSTLQFLGMLKYWKGKHIVLKKQDVLEEYLERVRRRGETRQIDSSCLRWRPFQPPPEAST